MKNINLLVAFILSVTPTFAHSQVQKWPTATVRVIVANAPGTAPDVAARVFADQLQRVVGQSVIVVNKPGGDGYIAASEVVHSAPDGHTLYFATQTIFGLEPHLKKKMPVDPVLDFTPIATVVDDTGATALFTSSASSIKTLDGLLAEAKTKPQNVSYASLVPLFTIMGTWVNERAKVAMLEVKYRSGSSAYLDLLTGRVTVMFDAYGSVEPQIQGGKVRVLAVTSPVEGHSYPLFTDTFPEYVRQPNYIALVGPANIPPSVVDQINKATATVVEDPKFNDGLKVLKWRNVNGARSASQTAELLRNAREIWGAFIKQAGISPM